MMWPLPHVLVLLALKQSQRWLKMRLQSCVGGKGQVLPEDLVPLGPSGAKSGLISLPLPPTGQACHNPWRLSGNVVKEAGLVSKQSPLSRRHIPASPQWILPVVCVLWGAGSGLGSWRQLCGLFHSSITSPSPQITASMLITSFT